MQCPKCESSQLKVLDSRSSKTAVRRRRECRACNHRFSTYESELEPVATTHAEELTEIVKALEFLKKKIERLAGGKVAKTPKKKQIRMVA